ncbi:PREDICTED: cystatin-like [Poecilia mexicana]|uniref:Cystatin domain-containing protein n=1 Tax=Poecilia mexicana TaxID=48701 RepID=A0A3B3YJI8_9TELE|nr:PREDICTED: cystatin-like [Poecilia mexicana]XP_014862857.1 PREDICTED: cystatin-like [Poecilia mexicana]
MWKIAFVLLSALAAVEGSLVGGATDIDIHNDGVQNALNFAVVQHNRRNNDMFLRQAAEVVKAQVQVVAGLKYILTVKMVKTSCRKNTFNQVCDVKSPPANAPPYQCIFTVWSRPWLNDIEMVEEKC